MQAAAASKPTSLKAKSMVQNTKRTVIPTRVPDICFFKCATEIQNEGNETSLLRGRNYFVIHVESSPNPFRYFFPFPTACSVRVELNRWALQVGLDPASVLCLLPIFSTECSIK